MRGLTEERGSTMLGYRLKDCLEEWDASDVVLKWSDRGDGTNQYLDTLVVPQKRIMTDGLMGALCKLLDLRPGDDKWRAIITDGLLVQSS